ncbi:MAG: 50S ribosomal protein L18e [Thermoplasmata archaeon HGW-Thermoplasmata-2]|nr:MAG: 50S ribosomal protein L18e [Thermoplasmata archaeon HGW-Thermoplasmata-2]
MVSEKTNPLLVALIADLKKAGREAPIWRDVADMLDAPVSRRIEFNVGRLALLNEGEIAVVAGKILGGGEISKKVVVGAYTFSASARAKIEKAGGSCLSLPEMVEQHPKGTGIRMVK